MQNLLTIAIPTYNRKSELRRTLVSIIPQLRPGVHLHITDNASDFDVAGMVKSLVNEKVRGLVHCVRNPANIGGGANILRAIEGATTKWVWLLSDDDVPSKDAVDTILRAIGASESRSCAFLFHFASAPWPREFWVARTPDAFAQHAHLIFRAMFLSAWVLRREVIYPHLREAYQTLHTACPHVVLAMIRISRGDEVVFLPDTVAEHKPAEDGQRWPFATVYHGATALLEMHFGLKGEARTRYTREIGRELLMMLPHYRLHLMLDSKLDHSAACTLDQVATTRVRSARCIWPGPRRAAMLVATKMLLRMPRVIRTWILASKFLKGRRPDTDESRW